MSHQKRKHLAATEDVEFRLELQRDGWGAYVLFIFGRLGWIPQFQDAKVLEKLDGLCTLLGVEPVSAEFHTTSNVRKITEEHRRWMVAVQKRRWFSK